MIYNPPLTSSWHSPGCSFYGDKHQYLEAPQGLLGLIYYSPHSLSLFLSKQPRFHISLPRSQTVEPQFDISQPHSQCVQLHFLITQPCSKPVEFHFPILLPRSQ